MRTWVMAKTCPAINRRWLTFSDYFFCQGSLIRLDVEWVLKVSNRVLAIHLVQWLGWVFALSPVIRLGLRTPRKKERKWTADQAGWYEGYAGWGTRIGPICWYTTLGERINVSERIQGRQAFGGGVSTTSPLFCLILTIISNKTGHFD